MELWQRRAVPEACAVILGLPVGAGNVCEQRHLPLQILPLLHAMSEAELHALRVCPLRPAERAVTEQAAADDVPLEIAQPEPLGHHHRVTWMERLQGREALAGHHLVVGGGAELRSAVAAGPVDRHGDEVFRRTVVEPARDGSWPDLTGLKIRGQDLDL